jgi:hypothetical protein
MRVAQVAPLIGERRYADDALNDVFSFGLFSASQDGDRISGEKLGRADRRGCW